MAATLKSLAEGSQALTVAYKDDPEFVTVWSRPLTARIERELNAMNTDGTSAGESIIPLFLSLIAKWDFRTDEKAKTPIPLTPEGMDDVPFELQMAIINAVMAEQIPKEATEEPSSDA